MTSTAAPISYRSQVVRAWCGPIMTLGFFVGLLVLAGFIPPPSPAADAAQIAAMFRENTVGIRVGLFISMLATGLLCPFYAAISGAWWLPVAVFFCWIVLTAALLHRAAAAQRDQHAARPPESGTRHEVKA